MGLGLSVARGFMEAMDGVLIADGSSGDGLTMRLRLPLAMTRILIVEDEPGLRRALTINLRARGYEVVAAADGAAARWRLPPASRPIW